MLRIALAALLGVMVLLPANAELIVDGFDDTAGPSQSAFMTAERGFASFPSPPVINSGKLMGTGLFIAAINYTFPGAVDLSETPTVNLIGMELSESISAQVSVNGFTTDSQALTSGIGTYAFDVSGLTDLSSVNSLSVAFSWAPPNAFDFTLDKITVSGSLPTPVPETTSLALVGLASAGGMLFRRRK
tara:strand:- start:70668 stop:71231 length:564 start_codon:yes stop_codon:yes gene_type:complete